MVVAVVVVVGLYSDGGELLYLLQGQTGGVTQVMFSQDGTKLYSGGRKVGLVINRKKSCDSSQCVYAVTAVDEISRRLPTTRSRVQSPAWSKVELWATFFATPSLDRDVKLLV